eukprot:scaffold18864_cov68-Phaeocystis_antarctica.AAC.4
MAARTAARLLGRVFAFPVATPRRAARAVRVAASSASQGARGCVRGACPPCGARGQSSRPRGS